ncbi:Hla Class I Histocompatibility Antigen, Alpha Chain F [Manis pentadactyla]|nr:Hla Class I Histocompatibility Antigen, Alpha Chain F [Manis pentadactyla]
MGWRHTTKCPSKCPLYELSKVIKWDFSHHANFGWYSKPETKRFHPGTAEVTWSMSGRRRKKRASWDDTEQVHQNLLPTTDFQAWDKPSAPPQAEHRKKLRINKKQKF